MGKRVRTDHLDQGLLLLPPTKTLDVKPVYPSGVQKARIQSVVVLEAVVNEAGEVDSTRILRSIQELDQAELDAVRQWTFMPTLMDGVPVPVVMTVTVNFRLQSRGARLIPASTSLVNQVIMAI